MQKNYFFLDNIGEYFIFAPQNNLHTLFMKHILLSVILFCAFSLLYSQSNEDLLRQLDLAIASKDVYQHQRFSTADSLSRLAETQTGEERVNTLESLHQIFLHFQTDSALSTLQRIKSLPEFETDASLRQRILIREAELYGMIGLYHEAFLMMEEVDLSQTDPQTMLVYYNTRHSVLGWMAEYASNSVPGLASQLHRQATAYHDSILAFEPDPMNRAIVQSNYEYDRGLYESSIRILNELSTQCAPGQQIYIYSNLAQAYERLGKTDESIRYLILTAIADLKAGVTEYMALPLLAIALHEAGDVDRAYSYLYCALEDANQSKASLRAMQVSQIFPIIHEAHERQIEHSRTMAIWVIILLVVLAGSLSAIVFSLWRLNRKLQSMRVLLAGANDQLRKSNLQLKQEENKIVDYLKSYLTRSRQYLASAETFQHQMLNLLQTRQLDELQKQLRSTQWTEEEEVRFYDDFDMVFLSLYPNFVEKFNALLKPEAHILPRKGELLTTELRIFALIRMGETDSARIAKFLNYSLTTIYNYRSRVRNNAVGDKDLFEEQVSRL